MRSFTTHLSIAAGLLAGAAQVAQAHPASELAIAVVRQQFVQADIGADLPLLAAFDPIGTLIVNFSSTPAGLITNGKQVAVADVQTAPDLKIKGTEEAEETAGGPFNVTTGRYTVILIDLQAPGNNQSTGTVRHYLEHDLGYGENDDHTVTLTHNSAPLTPYGGPAPPAGSGPHRYTWLLFSQPANFTPPASLNSPTGVERFNFTAWHAESGLSAPLAGVYFEASNNDTSTTTVSVAPTSAVVTSTLPAWTTAQTAVDHGHGSASASASASPSRTGAASSLRLPSASSVFAAVFAIGAGAWAVL